MKLFAKPKLKDDQRKRCLLYHDEQLRVAAFLDREQHLLDEALGAHWPAITASPQAAGELCRASDRFQQAVEEALRRHTAIQPVPRAAAKLHAAENSYLLHIGAWAKANLDIMETLARGRPPFYVPFERLKDQADCALQQAKETYWSFRRRLELTTSELESLQTILNASDSEEAGIDDWQPEPYAQDSQKAPSENIRPRIDGPRATVSTMMNDPAVGTNTSMNLNVTPVEGEKGTVPICGKGAAIGDSPRDRPDLSAWHDEGCELIGVGRYEEAIACFDKALDLDSQDATAWFNKGLGLAALGRHEEAIPCYDKVLTIDSQDMAAWFNKGVNLAALNRREEAIACFDTVLAIDARDDAAWCARGVNLAALGQHEEALGCWDRALEIDANCVAAWCAKGVSLAMLGRQEEALGCCDEALKIDAQIGPVWSNKGDCLIALGRHEEAVVCCDTAVRIDPKDEMAWFNKGVGLAALARHAEAIGCFDEALNLAPTLAAAWSKKGNSLASLHQPGDAIVCYARAVRIDPRDAAAWYNKALREQACDRREDAVESYRQFLEVAPPGRTDLIAAAKAKIEALAGTAARNS